MLREKKSTKYKKKILKKTPRRDTTSIARIGYAAHLAESATTASYIGLRRVEEIWGRGKG
jgi:hypothetical protein